jgi:glutathione S-transferase
MHAGFGTLREQCTMNCGIRVRLATIGPALQEDISRIAAIWEEGIARFGGPFLGGAQFHAVDAMFAPVALRFQTYGIALPGAAGAYGKMMLDRPSMRAWYEAALQEVWREPGHEEEAHRAGTWLEDLRLA